VLAVRADVSNPDDCAEFMQQTIARFGPLDILVNNAGRSSTMPFEQSVDKVWQEDIEVTLYGVICGAWARQKMLQISCAS
jgi:NAD(P)-dependent dehydrogenase (short-subunit alcohol dehydrogenase family)